MPEERYEFVKNTDIIHNIYNDTNTLLAMGNKYYDGLIFRIPQICMLGSFMGQLCEKHGIGISLDPQDEYFADKLYYYYKNLKIQDFYNGAERVLKDVLLEYKLGVEFIREVIK